MSLLSIICIGLGGATGALLRALVGRVVQTRFPWATLSVNVTGSFLLAAALTGFPVEAELTRALIGAGFCGAFTTFSTFALEVVLLARTGNLRAASLYLLSTVALCCLASWGGVYLMT